jgi:hypothetical protein
MSLHPQYLRLVETEERNYSTNEQLGEICPRLSLRNSRIEGFVRVQDSPVGATVEFEESYGDGTRISTAPAECGFLLEINESRYSPCQISRGNIPTCPLRDL